MSTRPDATAHGFSEAGRSFARAAHDHRRCVARALDVAGKLCLARGARLTALRRRVLALVWRSHRPVGAYDILALLRRGRVAPPTVYRALDFLIGQGLVHRIESLNAFVGCARPQRAHACQFLICTDCRAAAEIDDPGLDDAVAKSARRARFVVRRPTVELLGLCARCADREGALVH